MYSHSMTRVLREADDGVAEISKYLNIALLTYTLM